MKHLLLLSNHLNEAYINHVMPDQTTLVLTKQQFTYFKFHQYRIIYHLSASRHFAQRFSVPYTYDETWEKVFKGLPQEDDYYIYIPNDGWMKHQLDTVIKTLKLKIHWLEDLNFYHQNIESALGNPPYKLEPLYKRWRQQFNILMDNGTPIGNAYSFDQENRGRPPKKLTIEPPLRFSHDAITKDVIDYVKTTFNHHPKSTKAFAYPVTKDDAEALLKHFLEHRIATFGQYQDAMMSDEPFMVHSLLSTLINLGILLAKDVVSAAEDTYHKENAPLNAIEGFIRQILGWREYIRGIYLIEMKRGYDLKNRLNHHHPTPALLYHAKTDLNCLHQTVSETIDNAYNHHIQRLMIIGNITNLMQINPQGIRTWFNEMYIDSFDWVVTPNVIGMAQYADGGLMSTKPYISSANYINNMSDYCQGCLFNPKEKTGAKACPVNALYYNFLSNHEATLRTNPRMKFMYANYDKIDHETLKTMQSQANQFILKETS